MGGSPYPYPPGEQPPVSYETGAPGPQRASEERTWAMFAHLGGMVLACLGWIPALIIYLLRKDHSSYVRHQAGEALNFQLTLLLGYVVTTMVWLGLGVFAPQFTALASLLIVAVWLLAIIFGVFAAIAANRGRWHRYPVALRLIS